MKRALKMGALVLLFGAAAGGLGATPARVRLPLQAAAQRPDSGWPDARRMEERRFEAQNLPLFAGTEPIEFTLTADFRAVQRDRNPESTKTFPAVIQFAGAGGSPVTMDLQIRTRGHARRSFNVCDFAPLRLEFQKDTVKGTVFEGQNAVKLGVHCREGVTEFERYVLHEYAAYRIYNLVTPQSFRARLARATYVDAVRKKPISTRYAMFIEDDEDVARRLGGRITEKKEDLGALDRNAFTRMTLFEYMIGNLDMSVIAFHNVKAVQTPRSVVYPVPYDFDYSGLVNASYALPPPGLGVTSVRDRVFRGPCRTSEELQPFLEQFRAIRGELPAMYASLPAFMDAGGRKRALTYLDGFYKVLDKPADVKKAFIDTCLKRGLM